MHFWKKKRLNWDVVVSVSNLFFLLLANLLLTCYPFNCFSTVLMFFYKMSYQRITMWQKEFSVGLLSIYLIFCDISQCGWNGHGRGTRLAHFAIHVYVCVSEGHRYFFLCSIILGAASLKHSNEECLVLIHENVLSQ